MRDRLRAGFSRDTRRDPQTDRGGDHRSGFRVVAVLTGNVLKDPDYIYRYHTGS